MQRPQSGLCTVGHLATITSAAENTFITSLLGGNSWLGGSDSVTEDDWYWVTGPENGTQFSTGNTAEPGQYANWDTGQPNDFGGGQDYFQIQTDGTWADFTNTDNDDYVIEWEGADIAFTDGASSDDTATNVIDGGNDNDTIYGSDGTDTLLGGAGDDIIYSGSGIGYTVADALAENPNATYYAATGNFYEYVNGNTNYAGAVAGAAASTLNGVAGHLATITSAGENGHIAGILGSDSWLGGDDAATEGDFYWNAGPDAGTQFWTGGLGGAPFGGMYANWQGGQPNDWEAGQDYFQIRSADGLWADWDAAQTDDYVIEWEGSAVLGGGGNISTLNGGSGADQLYGADGEDWFIFDSNGGDAFTNPDTIHDFDETDNDTIDISDILSGYGVNAGNLALFVDIDSANGVRIDLTGSSSFAGNEIGTFVGTTTVSDEATLLGNGQLII